MTSPPRRTSRRDQGGYVLPMFAITLTVLMAMAGFGVDVWNWWYQAQKMQRAADSAALAGVIYMPSDLASARTTAWDVALANGYAQSSVNPAVGTRANRLRVTVNGTVQNHFVSLLGLSSTTITRDAEAEYTGVVETGSPINQMGNQPVGPGDTGWNGAVSAVEATNPQVWAQIAGQGNSKENGDRYAAGGCSSANYQCSGGVNQEYTNEGYFYTIRVTVASGDLSKALLVDVYDPAFTHQGDTCNNFAAGTGANEGTIRSGLAALGERFDPTNVTFNSKYCPGDNISTGGISNYQTQFPTVTFRTAGPDATPWNVKDNFTNSPISACNGTHTSQGAYPATMDRFRPYGSNQSVTIAGTSYAETPANLPRLVAATPENSYASRVYHQWVRVCAVSLASIGITTAGEYDISFNTDIVDTPSRTGHNRYAIRAGLGSAPNATTSIDGTKVSVFANGPMPLYQNVQGSTAAFFLARVLPGAANRVLNVEFWDTGDGSGSGTIQILPPTDSNVSGGVFSGCTASLTGGTTPSMTASTCQLTGVSSGSGYNGQRVQVRVPIPNNYTCALGSSTGCWTRVRFVWSQDIADTTTWRATIVGDPVRLTE